MSKATSVSVQTHLKVIAVLLIAIGAISIPADLPYHDAFAAVLLLVGAIGYAIAQYSANPATIVLDMQQVADVVVNFLKQEKSAAAEPKPTVDPTSLIADLSNLGQQVQMIVAKYQATPTGQTSTANAPPAAQPAASATPTASA